MLRKPPNETLKADNSAFAVHFEQNEEARV